LQAYIDCVLTGQVLDEAERQTLLGGGAALRELDGLLVAATAYLRCR
jgi:hypothetical protein